MTASKELPYNRDSARPDGGGFHDRQQADFQGSDHHPASNPAALGLQPGDELLYEIIDGQVILTKVRRGATTDDPFVTFEEWGSEADTKAYADL